MTEKVMIKLDTVDKVKCFTDLNQAAKCTVQVKAADGSLIPGDSIMGLFATSLLEPLEVEIASDDESSARRLLDNYRQHNIQTAEQKNGSSR